MTTSRKVRDDRTQIYNTRSSRDSHNRMLTICKLKGLEMLTKCSLRCVALNLLLTRTSSLIVKSHRHRQTHRTTRIFWIQTSCCTASSSQSNTRWAQVYPCLRSGLAWLLFQPVSSFQRPCSTLTALIQWKQYMLAHLSRLPYRRQFSFGTQPNAAKGQTTRHIILIAVTRTQLTFRHNSMIYNHQGRRSNRHSKGHRQAKQNRGMI